MKLTGVRVALACCTLDDVARSWSSALAQCAFRSARGGRRGAARASRQTIVGAASPRWSLAHARGADVLDADEWDRLLGERGTFTVDGLMFLERAFARRQGGRRTTWAFRYYVVPADAVKPVAATFFTAALWKDDMLAAEVSSWSRRARRGGSVLPDV